MRKSGICLTVLLFVCLSLVMVSCGDDPFFHDVKVIGPDGKDISSYAKIAFNGESVILPTLKDIDPDGTKRPQGKILAYMMDGKELDANTTSVTVSKAVTIEAVWVDGFYITYDSNNSSKSTKVYAVRKGSECRLDDGSAFTEADRKIGSWNTTSDCDGTRYELSAVYVYEGAADITLYAKWRQKEDVVITYEANGATSGTAPSPSKGCDPEETDEEIASQGTLEKTDMTFIGWNTEADGSGEAYQPGDRYKGEVSITLYAQWAEGFVITYHYKNSEGKDSLFTSTVAFGSKPVYAEAPSDAPVGYAFDAWYADAATAVEDKAYVSGEEGDKALTENIDLYAVWIDEDVDFALVNGGYSARISAKGTAKREAYTVVIPSYYHGKKVVAVSDNGFYSGSDSSGYPIADVTIPDTVITIGDNAFRATKLSAVTIPENVTSIGKSAFSSCEQLSAADFEGKELKTISDYAFSLTAITSIEIPEGVTELGYCTFGVCSKLDEVTLPNTLEKIGARCFNSCEKLESIVIPKSVTSVGDEVFDGCKALKEVRILSEGDTLVNSDKWKTPSSCVLTWGEYSIGDKGPAGGVIFYRADKVITSTGVDGNEVKWRYMEVAPEDAGEIKFGFYKTAVTEGTSAVLSSDNTAIGKGGSNTRTIADTMKDHAYSNQDKDVATEYAIKTADDYEYTNPDDGKTYTDWFLPSRDEFEKLLNASLEGKIDFGKTSDGDGYFSYWTSSEESSQNVYSNITKNGAQVIEGVSRGNPTIVRTVRYVPVTTDET